MLRFEGRKRADPGTVFCVSDKHGGLVDGGNVFLEGYPVVGNCSCLTRGIRKSRSIYPRVYRKTVSRSNQHPTPEPMDTLYCVPTDRLLIAVYHGNSSKVEQMCEHLCRGSGDSLTDGIC